MPRNTVTQSPAAGAEIPTTVPTITPEIANHVLWCFNDRSGYEPGSFTLMLLRAIAAADQPNRARLALGFRGYVAAYELAMNDYEGLAVLATIAAGVAR